MTFLSKTSASSPSLNLNKIHTKLKICNDTSIAEKTKFCKTCCKPCHICPRILAKYKAQLQMWRRYGKSDNFVLIGAKCIMEFYRWTNENHFLKSIVASAILFAIGIKLTGEMNAWNLSQTVGR
ncbi:uncharacterized protein LOC114941117 [Nylanderia fulva]|uniref:uncharacterized protein LOC114941117 n=1 Tax=Nylanderia fulva TaxID=613905 RepID=UPI0010FB9304|nr:uncharacterized protein LOC114941117 [Nylanderia fulva]